MLAGIASWALGLFGGKASGGLERMLLSGLLAVALAGAAWFIHDWHAAKTALALERASTERALADKDRALAAKQLELDQAHADLAAARATAQRRAGDAADLQAALAQIKEVPDASFPVAPRIDAALDRLRRP